MPVAVLRIPCPLMPPNATIGAKDAIYEMADEAVCAFVIAKRYDAYGTQPSAGEKLILRIPAFAFLYLLGNAGKHGYRGVK